MLKTRFIPFYSDNNSSNLPFYLLQDKRGNDIIYINDKNIIYTNQRISSINDQLNLYDKCVNQGICCYYKINKDLAVIKKQIDKDICWFLVNGDEQTAIYQTKYDGLEDVRLNFNDKYFCLTSMEYGKCTPSIVAGCDITKQQLLDCSDYKTENSLYKSLVEIRMCDFDCVYSILSNKLLNENKENIFSFLSFIFDKTIDTKNYKKYLPLAKNYIMEKYPILDKLKRSLNKQNINDCDKKLDVKYFYFNRIEKTLDNLKYLQNKTYSKLKV